jgi:hypothetical protein
MRYAFFILVLFPVLGFAEYRIPAGINVPFPIAEKLSDSIPNSDYPNIEKEFVEYITNFKRDYLKFSHKTINLNSAKIAWAEGLFVYGENVGGICHKSRFTWWIEIGNHWRNLTDCQREDMIYHELGHCVLNEDHSPNGIMDPQSQQDEECKDRRDLKKKIFFLNEGTGGNP